MSSLSAGSEFAEYRAIGSGVAIVPSVSVVIPAMNEASNLKHVFATIPEWVDEIVLVDGHSVDDTVAVARQLYPAVNIVHQQGRGKGGALQEGFAAAKGEIIVMMDADGSTDGGEIPRFVAALVTGADFAKGSRFASGGGSDDITFSRSLGNKILSWLVNKLFGTRYTDLCYGYNAFWAKHLSRLDLDCDGFEIETVMNVRAAKAGLAIHEIPSYEHARLHGMSNLNPVRDGIRIAKFIVREHFGGRPVENTAKLKVDAQELPSAQELPPVALAVPTEAALWAVRSRAFVMIWAYPLVTLTSRLARSLPGQATRGSQEADR
jgi:glycosyltransferase involved in cell wall biosynthesis